MNLKQKLKCLLVAHSKFVKYQVCLYLKQKPDLIIPVFEGAGLANVTHPEPGVKKTIQHLLETTTGTFIDVGANIGQTLLTVKACQRNAPYIGFEPQHACIGYLARLISVNQFPHCDIFPLGLWSEHNVSQIHTSGAYDAGSSLIPELRSREYTATQICCAEKGDRVMNDLNNPRVSIIKIDVEGAELEVLDGFANTVARQRPFIIAEIHPIDEIPKTSDLAIEREARYAKWRDFSTINEYTCFQIAETGIYKSENFAAKIMDPDPSNYLFAPTEQVKKLQNLITVPPQ